MQNMNVKRMLVTLCVAAVIGVMASAYVINSNLLTAMQHVESHSSFVLEQLAQHTAEAISPADLASIKSPRDLDTERFLTIQHRLQRYASANHLDQINFLRFVQGDIVQYVFSVGDDPKVPLSMEAKVVYSDGQKFPIEELFDGKLHMFGPGCEPPTPGSWTVCNREGVVLYSPVVLNDTVIGVCETVYPSRSVFGLPSETKLALSINTLCVCLVAGCALLLTFYNHIHCFLWERQMRKVIKCGK